MGFAGRYSGRYVGAYAGARFKPSTLSSYLFDGGMHKPARAIILDACELLLERLLKVNGGYLEAIEQTDEIVRSVDDEHEIGQMIDLLGTRAPAILLATGDSDFDPAGDVSRWSQQIDVHVYFWNANARDRRSRVGQDVVALGDPTADPGVFVMLEHARMLLCGQKPGAKTQLKELIPIAERRIGGDGSRVLWEQIYRVKTSVSIDLKRDISLELQQITTYNRFAEQSATENPIVTTDTELTT